MKKKIAFLILVTGLLLGSKGFSTTISYEDIRTFSCFEGVGGEGPVSQFIWGNGYEYSHKMPQGFDPGVVSVVNASVSISGYWIDEGNNVSVAETSLGYLNPGNDICPFPLCSNFENYTPGWFLGSSVTVFDIDHIFDSWSGGNNIGISIVNEKAVFGSGIFKLSESVFKLDYENFEVANTPEPGALVLLSSGILFLAAVCRKKYKKYSSTA